MNTNVAAMEDPSDTLLREATEFIELYYHERQDEMKGTDGFLSKEERMGVVKRSIEETGTYVHTFDELQHGSRVAWRVRFFIFLKKTLLVSLYRFRITHIILFFCHKKCAECSQVFQ